MGALVAVRLAEFTTTAINLIGKVPDVYAAKWAGATPTKWSGGCVGDA